MVLSELKEKLRNGVVKFEYNKKNGEHRVAYGTLKPEFIKALGYTASSSKSKKKNEELTAYFDVEKEGWRSFNNFDLYIHID
jgi:hypothetical protein